MKRIIIFSVALLLPLSSFASTHTCEIKEPLQNIDPTYERIAIETDGKIYNINSIEFDVTPKLAELIGNKRKKYNMLL